MTFQLKSLGPYRIERTEDWNNDPDNSYAEMIRVRGSKPRKLYFMVPSHLYKHSEKELGLYLNERKNTWRAIGKLINTRIDTSDPEIMVHFPVSMFPKIAEIVPFVRKKTRVTPLSDQERERASHLRSYRKDIMEQNRPKTVVTESRQSIFTGRVKNHEPGE